MPNVNSPWTAAVFKCLCSNEPPVAGSGLEFRPCPPEELAFLHTPGWFRTRVVWKGGMIQVNVLTGDKIPAPLLAANATPQLLRGDHLLGETSISPLVRPRITPSCTRQDSFACHTSSRGGPILPRLLPENCTDRYSSLFQNSPSPSSRGGPITTVTDEGGHGSTINHKP